MLSRTRPRHACETPLIQGNGPGHTWACGCGRNWTVQHRIGEYGGLLTWVQDRQPLPAWLLLASRRADEPVRDAA